MWTQEDIQQSLDSATRIFEGVGLSGEEIAAIKLQGFVSTERRGPDMTIFKLRFRLAGRQRVKYLGTDRAAAAIFRDALLRLQQSRRLDGELRYLSRQASKLLQFCKQVLQPGMEQTGFKFHGRALRRTRRGADHNLTVT